MALFSIVTVTYNNLSGLERTACSIRGQSCDDYEWIVIDGDSQDGTKEFLGVQKECHWISEADEGIYDAMNKGMEKASGTYIIFMNAGDVFAEKDVLSEVSYSLKEHAQDIDFIYGDAFEGGNYKTARLYNEFEWGMFTHHQAMFYKTERLKAYRYDSNLNIAADYDLTCRFLQKAQNVLYLPFPICNFEAGGLSQQQAVLGRKQQYQIRKDLRLCTPFKNKTIYFMQICAYLLRNQWPFLYWKIRG